MARSFTSGQFMLPFAANLCGTTAGPTLAAVVELAGQK